MNIKLRARLSAYTKVESMQTVTDVNVPLEAIESLFADGRHPDIDLVTPGEIDSLFPIDKDVIVTNSQIDSLFGGDDFTVSNSDIDTLFEDNIIHVTPGEIDTLFTPNDDQPSIVSFAAIDSLFN